MRVGSAREAAADWVARHARHQADFLGAYLIGSTVDLLDDAEVPPGSDIDVVVVISGSSVPPKPGKTVHSGVLLDVTLLPWSLLSSPDVVLTSYHLAAGLHVDAIVADPTGRLRTLQEYVARHFAEEVWVLRRCQNVREDIEAGLKSIDTGAPWHDQVMAWLFATGRTAHVILVAALRNPTVRLRYLAAREVLDQYGQRGLHADLLRLLGCAEMSADRVEHHVAALARTFDAAAAAAETRFSFSSDVTLAARPTAIEASRNLIRAGNHREAMFWIVASFVRCDKILAADASPATQHEFARAFTEVLQDIGIASTQDLLSRGESVRLFLPELSVHAEQILAANPGVTGDVTTPRVRRGAAAVTTDRWGE